jgi:FkbM family methyltransferase
MRNGALRIRLSNQVTLAAPGRLDSITAYVLLEQETWFEKELSFLERWLKSGMTAIDIGANLGVYALLMARLVGPHGRVLAYEPGSEARDLLQQSREINAASNLEIFNFALSDCEREGRLLLNASSELNALGDTGFGEQVRITSLDAEIPGRDLPPPDFVKIDAEGEEERILAGGRDFFARYSPLVVFEIKAGPVINENLPAAFRAIGYELFRLLVGAPILVPLDLRVPLDPFELNLFACKPDRIGSLREEGFLVDQISPWAPDTEAISNGLSLLHKRAFASMFGDLRADVMDRDYLNALAAFAAWRTNDLPSRARCAALYFAYQTLAALCNRAPTTARCSTFARIAWEGGWRAQSVTALNQIVTHIRRTPFQAVEPCWPPNPRFDDIPADNNPALWFAIAAIEQLERAQSFSTCFSVISPWLAWLCDQPAASHEMHRRKTLLAALAGLNPIVPACLRNEAPDHLNAEVWRSGMVPGTRVS